MKRKIIVVAIKAGGGHIAAMNSIISALSTNNIFEVESFISTNTILNKVHEFLNFKLPLLYDISYNIADLKASRLSQDILVQDVLIEFREEFKQFFTDSSVATIVSTHYLTTQALLELKEEYVSNINIIAYVPDYDTSLIHFPVSSIKDLNGLISQSYTFLNRVASETNFPWSKMQKGGFIVSNEFRDTSLVSKISIYEDLDNSVSPLNSISKSKLKILVAGGSGWTGTISNKIKKLIKALEENLGNFQFLVISGSNEESVKKYLTLKNKFHNLDIIILPKLTHNDLSKVYKVADLVLLASIAPASLYELMTVDAAPILLVKANPGQEFYNKSFAVEQGLVELCLEQDTLNRRVVELFENKEKLEKARLMARWNYRIQLEIAQYNAAKMAEFIIER